MSAATALPRLEAVSPSLCPLRWTYMQVDLQHGKVKACCKTPFHAVSQEEISSLGIESIFDGPYFRARRQEMLAGARHDDCATCWQQEELGLVSYRQSEGAKDSVRPVLDRIARERATTGLARHIEIIFSTTCDLRCCYCGPEFSSAWAAEVARHGNLPVVSQPALPGLAAPGFADVFWRWFEREQSTIEYVQVNGGEPLISRWFYDFVDRVLASERQAHFQLGLISNLNTPPRRLAELLPRLGPLIDRHRLRFGVSQDSVGKRAEYIRNGLSWDRFAQNLRTVLAAYPQLDVQIAPTMSALNVTSIAELLAWLDRLTSDLGVDIVLRPSIVMWPEFQSPLILPTHFSRHLHRAVRLLDDLGRWPAMSRYIEAIADAMERMDGAETLVPMRQAFYAYFREYDRRRGLELPAVFPELADFWTECANLEESHA